MPKTPLTCVRCETPIKIEDLYYWIQISTPFMVDGVWRTKFFEDIDKPLCGPACAATLRGQINTKKED